MKGTRPMHGPGEWLGKDACQVIPERKRTQGNSVPKGKKGREELGR
jgi:hypothetical protein